jgi:hypothetical protein
MADSRKKRTRLLQLPQIALNFAARWSDCFDFASQAMLLWAVP